MYQKSWSYAILFLRYIVRDGCNCSISFGAIFYPVTALTAQKKQPPGGIIILHKCTKNPDHMLHCSWDMACDRCNCNFLFWAIFAILPLTAQKIKTSKNKNKKTPGDIIYTFIPKTMIRWCTVPQIWCTIDRQAEKVTYRGGCPS